MMKKMGISDDDLDNLTNEMMSAFGGAEGMEGLMPQDREDGAEDDGRAATFPFPACWTACFPWRSGCTASA